MQGVCGSGFAALSMPLMAGCAMLWIMVRASLFSICTAGAGGACQHGTAPPHHRSRRHPPRDLLPRMDECPPWPLCGPATSGYPPLTSFPAVPRPLAGSLHWLRQARSDRMLVRMPSHRLMGSFHQQAYASVKPVRACDAQLRRSRVQEIHVVIQDDPDESSSAVSVDVCGVCAGSRWGGGREMPSAFSNPPYP